MRSKNEKNTLLAIVVVFSEYLSAQIPRGYYDGTERLTEYTLKTKLKTIINEGAINRGYNALMIAYKTSDTKLKTIINEGAINRGYNALMIAYKTSDTKLKTIINEGAINRGYNALIIAYKTGDLDKYYENDNTILDIYSENPNGSNPYAYILEQKECGSYTYESDCYNREHLFPQSFFSSKYPMRNDYFHIYPADGKVNGFRNNYPFGTVGVLSSPSNTISNATLNGSKLGTSNFLGYLGTVFEPIDEFKGDCRALLYFITRYEDKLQTFNVNDLNNLQDENKDCSFHGTSICC